MPIRGPCSGTMGSTSETDTTHSARVTKKSAEEELQLNLSLPLNVSAVKDLKSPTSRGDF